MKNLTKIAIVILILVASNAFAQETSSPKFGKGLFNLVGKDSTWTMKMGMRMQMLSSNGWDIDSNGDYEKAESSFLIRRARLKFGGFAYSPKLVYKIELGLSNKDIGGASEFTNNAPRYILDAVVKWNFYKNLTLWAGQTKLPGNRERVISSGNLQFVDRSMLNKNFNIDRDVGLQLRHKFNLSEKFLVRDMFAISQGEGRNITTGNLGGHQYTARVELLPFGEFVSKGDYSGSDLKREQTPKLAIGATYNFNDRAVKNRGSQGSYLAYTTGDGFFETNVTQFFIDAMFKYKGFSFMGEYADRDATEVIAFDADGITPTGDAVKVGNGLNLQAGYLFQKNWEVAARYTSIDYSTVVEQYTFGISKYISGHKLKVQSDVSYSTIEGDGSELLYRLQLDVHF